MLTRSEEAYRAVLGLRTVRRFRPEQVDAEDLERILEAARWTGSSKNRQSWSLVLVTERERLDRLAECGDFTTPLRNAPMAIAPVMAPDGYEWDMGRLSQNIMLAAASLGVGSCPVTLHREECGRRVLELPVGHECRIVIALGYPDEEEERRARGASPLGGRKPLEDLVHQETF